jgi:hypothetical protein
MGISVVESLLATRLWSEVGAELPQGLLCVSTVRLSFAVTADRILTVLTSTPQQAPEQL